ncbi:MAG: nucleotidyltransferase domain-containing protein [Chloroflexi bacterium]|nr:nucleotidyltransferase domain-containing protein [Chloroflexota bacterium]
MIIVEVRGTQELEEEPVCDPRTRKRILGVLAGVPGLSLAYLFGSQANGLAGPLSDYDVAILVDETLESAALRTQLAHELAIALETDRVDVVVLNRAPVELAYVAIAQAEVLFQRDEATRVEFEANTMSRYGDYLPVLRAQRRDICRGGEHAARVQRYREALGRTERKIGQIRASRAEKQS